VGDAVRFVGTLGNGAATASVGVNGAAPTTLGTPTGPAQPYIRTEDKPLDIGQDSTSGTPVADIDGVVQTLTLYKANAGSPTGSTFYVSPAGSGGCTSRSDTCSLATGISNAASAGPGSTVLLRAGVYRQTSALAFTSAHNGITLQNYPREVPIISGHSLVSGTWSQDSGQVYKVASAPTIDFGNQVFLFGVRCNLSKKAIASPTTWAVTGTGYTANASDTTTIDAFARPDDVIVEWRGTFRHGFTPLTNVSGSTLTANTTAFANGNSAVGIVFSNTTFPILNSQLTNYYNARELMTNAFDYYYNAGTSTLYIQMPALWVASTGYTTGSYVTNSSGNVYLATNGGFSAASGGPTGTGAAITDGTTTVGPVTWSYVGTVTSPTVEIGATQQLVTVTGALGTPATGITFRGITFEGSTWSDAHDPATIGYADLVSGVTGNTGDYFGVQGPYYQQPAAIALSVAPNTTFEGCTFRRFAAAALSVLYGSKNVLVTGSTFTDINGDSIYDGDITATAATQSNSLALVTGNVYRDNMFTLQARKFLASSVILRGYTSGTVIDRNTFTGSGYAAVHTGWGWGAQNASPSSNMDNCSVTRNYITLAGQGMGVSYDGAGIYANGPEATTSLVDSNYVEPFGNIGFYVDNGKTHTTFSNNVIGPSSYNGYWCAVNQSEYGAMGNVISTNYAPYNVTYNIAESTGSLQTLTGNQTYTSGITPPFSGTALAILTEAGL